MAERPDMATLVAGLCVVLFGVVLLLHASDELTLRFAALAPIGTFVAGATLLASGLDRRD